MGLVEKPAGSGDVAQGQVGVFKQARGMAKPRVEHVGVWGQAKGGLERPMEMVDRETGNLCELNRAHHLVEVPGHVGPQTVAHSLSKRRGLSYPGQWWAHGWTVVAERPCPQA